MDSINTRSNQMLLINVLLLAGLLLFLAPFVEFKVRNLDLLNIKLGMSITGVDLVMGSSGNSGNNFYPSDIYESAESGKETDMNLYALAAAVFGLISLVLSFLSKRYRTILNALFSLLAGVALIALFIDLKSKFNKAMGGEASIRGAEISLDFTPWFYISLITFFVAAFLSFKLSRNYENNTPPKYAPQTPLENPGDQSDFPKSASESEVG